MSRVCHCCGRTVTAEQDAEAKRLEAALDHADRKLSVANYALSQAAKSYAAAKKARAKALRAKLAQSDAVHGPLTSWAYGVVRDSERKEKK